MRPESSTPSGSTAVQDWEGWEEMEHPKCLFLGDPEGLDLNCPWCYRRQICLDASSVVLDVAMICLVIARRLLLFICIVPSLCMALY